MACSAENLVDISESDAINAKFVLYCSKCGRVVETKKTIEKDVLGDTWLPCIEYTGMGSIMTTGPIQAGTAGLLWGDPGGGSISEEEFIRKHGINPRIDWCNRYKKNRKNHPLYDTICGKAIRSIQPIVYHIDNDGLILKPRRIPSPIND